MVQPLDVIGKIGEFVTKFTGSNYGYTEPSGEIRDNYQQIGEIFGFPVYLDDNNRYENEFLDFPTLGDILTSIGNTGISYEVKFGECSVCLVINYSIPLVTYPPIIICLAKPDCKDEPEDRPCIPEAEYEKVVEQLKTYTGEDPPPQELLNKLKKPVCLDRPPGIPDAPEPFPDNRIPSGFGCFEFATNGTTIIRSSYGQNEVYPPVPEENLSWSQVCEGDYFDPLWNPGANIGEYIFDEQPGWFWSVWYRSRVVGRGFSVDHNLSIGWDYRYGGGSSSGSTKTFNWIAFRQIEGQPNPPSTTPRPPDPPIPDPTLPMNNQCCDDIKKILARIERDLRDIHRVINPKQWQKKECTVPASFIYPTGETHNIVLEDLPDYLGAIVRTIDRKGGALPQIVNVRDADPEIEGDQGIQIVVNSIADLCKLTLEYLIQTQGNVGAIQMMQVANLYESAFTHQISAAAERKIQAICEFLDFEAKDVKTILKMAFNPTVTVDSKDDLQKLLPKLIKPHEQPLEEYQWAGGESLKDMIMDIRKKATFAAAGATETRDPDAVIDQFLQLERVKRLLQVREIDERLGIKGLKDFFDESEAGYPDSNLDRTFKQRPYGFEPVNKPKFKKATKGTKKRRYIKEKPPKEGK